MKRNLKADQPTEIHSPVYPETQENEFERMASYMVEIISKRFRNQAIKGLDKTTVDKFADSAPAVHGYEFKDAETGNFAKVFLRHAKRVQRKMIRQFDDERIERMTREILKQVNRHNRTALYNLVENRIGVSAQELMATEGLTFTINALELETVQWITRLRDETLENYTANTLRVMAQGGSLTDVLSEFDGMVEKRKNHAKFTARNQIANFNSLLTKNRARNLGITKARWLTSEDERVRECHRVRNGKEFDLEKGLYASCDGKWLLPGIDYQCRCDYELIIPEDDE